MRELKLKLLLNVKVVYYVAPSRVRELKLQVYHLMMLGPLVAPSRVRELKQDEIDIETTQERRTLTGA